VGLLVDVMERDTRSILQSSVLPRDTPDDGSVTGRGVTAEVWHDRSSVLNERRTPNSTRPRFATPLAHRNWQDRQRLAGWSPVGCRSSPAIARGHSSKFEYQPDRQVVICDDSRDLGVLETVSAEHRRPAGV